MEFLKDIVVDAGMDTIKLIPFLVITYLLMEMLEHHTGDKYQQAVEKAGKLGPFVGSIVGALPQCGFSAAASSLYAGRVITMGTLIAVYLSTSDEMLPILISESVPLTKIFAVLGLKALIGMISGLALEFVFSMRKKKHEDMDIHKICEQEHCHCEDSVIVSALKHTLKIVFYIFILSLLLNALIGWVGEDVLASVLTSVPVVGQVLAALVGLIPNCAASVVITELYLKNIISFGAMMSGLLVGAGVGLLILFRLNRHWKENVAIIGILYGLGVFWGVIIEIVEGIVLK